MNNWQDIKTAPKDGTDFWIGNEDLKTVGHWDANMGCFIIDMNNQKLSQEIMKNPQWKPLTL